MSRSIVPTSRRERATLSALLAAILLLASADSGLAQATTASTAGQVGSSAVDGVWPSPQRRGRGRPERGVYKSRIEPHWFADDAHFWFRTDLAGRERQYVLVDADQGTSAPAFDHAKLAESLSAAADRRYSAKRLTLEELEFATDLSAIQFSANGERWTCDLTSYECTRWEPHAAVDGDDRSDEDLGRGGRGRFGGRNRFNRRAGRDADRDRSVESPDGKWTALVRDDNVFIRPEGEEQDIRLSDDGAPDNRYGMLEWAPDSRTLVAFRIRPGEEQEVHLIESSPGRGGRAGLRSRPYPLPGDRFTAFELNLFDVANQKQIKPEVDLINFGWPRLRWYPNERHFAYRQVDRGHQRLRLVRVDSHTGTATNLIDEQTETFIWTAHTENVDLEFITWLEESDEIVYACERDGWRHLYLIDAVNGGVKHEITSGEYVVRGIDRIDEGERQIWFRASGKNPDQDPYFIHYYRVNFDGAGLVALTEGNGNHSVQFSPDYKFLVDTYSRVDTPPVHELRRASDGSLVCRLEEADISELQATGWQPLEVFTAKGRDGKTDIWGVIARPRDFDPEKTYAVIESIYAGPQGSFVPKSFSAANRYESLTDLGFVVVQIDGMGTANRSKAFHDVCWHNLKDAGFPDRILWIQAAAEKHPYMDLSRGVGIYGGSAGGQNAAAGVLFHPEFYTVAVAGCGCHDNRMDKASWNEQWMGYPVGPQYSACSNIDNAERLQGKLLLIVGELDENVPPESTYRLVDALIKAGKDFEFVLVPGAGHGMGGTYGQRRMQDFLVRHLLGTEPPNRNGAGEN